MRFNILSDADWDSRVDKVHISLSELGYWDFFEKRHYGDTLDGVTVVLMCRNPEYHFKQRIRYAKKEKKIYLDIMLDLNQFREMEQTQREREIAKRLVEEIPPIIGKYKLSDFDLRKFENDLRGFFKKIKWLG